MGAFGLTDLARTRSQDLFFGGFAVGEPHRRFVAKTDGTMKTPWLCPELRLSCG